MGGHQVQRVLYAQVPAAVNALLALGVVCVLMTLRIMYSNQPDRPFLAYDARISHALIAHDTVHPVLAVLVPFIMLLGTLAVSEGWLGGLVPHQPAVALAVALHYVFDFIVASVLTWGVTGTSIIG